MDERLPLVATVIERRVFPIQKEARLPNSYHLNERHEGELPNMSQEQRDSIALLVGDPKSPNANLDGRAKVTVSGSASFKNFGTGVDVHMSVTLSVHQNEAYVHAAAAWARNILDQNLPKHLEIAKQFAVDQRLLPPEVLS